MMDLNISFLSICSSFWTVHQTIKQNMSLVSVKPDILNKIIIQPESRRTKLDYPKPSLFDCSAICNPQKGVSEYRIPISFLLSPLNSLVGSIFQSRVLKHEHLPDPFDIFILVKISGQQLIFYLQIQRQFCVLFCLRGVGWVPCLGASI